MAKEKDFTNVVELTKSFHSERAEMHGRDSQSEFNRWYMEWVLQIQLAQLQQVTMLAKHIGDIAAEVERTAKGK